MKYFFFLFIFLSVQIAIARQDSEADSILQLIRNHHGKDTMDKELYGWYNRLGNIYFNSGKEGLAIEYMQKALQVAEKTGEVYRLATAYGGIGEFYFYMDYYYLALENLVKSYTLAANWGFQDSAGYVMVDLGNTYYSFRQYELASDFYKKAETVFRKLNNFYGLAVVYNNFGLIKSSQGQHDSAIVYFTKGMELRKNESNPCLLSHSFNYIGREYAALGNTDQAMFYFNEAEKPFKLGRCAKNDLSILFSVYINMAGIYIKQESFSLAEKFTRQAFSLAQDSIGSGSLMSRVYQEMASLNRKQKKYDAAVSNLQKGLVIGDSSENMILKRKCYSLLAGTYEEWKKPDSAIKYLKLYNLCNDSINNQSVTNKLFEVRSAVDMFEKSHQIKIKEAQEQRTKAMVEKDKVHNRFYLIILAISLVAGLWIFRLYKKNKKLKDMVEKHTNR